MKRPKTGNPGKGKKSVGFSLTGTKIEAPESYQFSGTTASHTNTKTEFKVEKAREFESYKQIPRF